MYLNTVNNDDEDGGDGEVDEGILGLVSKLELVADVEVSSARKCFHVNIKSTYNKVMNQFSKF